MMPSNKRVPCHTSAVPDIKRALRQLSKMVDVTNGAHNRVFHNYSAQLGQLSSKASSPRTSLIDHPHELGTG